MIYFLPAFYQNVFPDLKTQFGLYNGLIQMIGGAICTIICGILGDTLEKKNRKAKAWIAIIGSALAIPAMAGCCLFKGVNFYVSLAFLAFKFFVSEGWMAPTIAMM